MSARNRELFGLIPATLLVTGGFDRAAPAAAPGGPGDERRVPRDPRLLVLVPAGGVREDRRAHLPGELPPRRARGAGPGPSAARLAQAHGPAAGHLGRVDDHV